MNITKKSQATGKVRTIDLPITNEQLSAWQSGVPAQEAFPNLTADQREFIMTGITKEEWDEIFGTKEPEL